VSRTLDRVRSPVYLLDPSRRIVYANPACARWLGHPQQSLLGLTCHYDTGGDSPEQRLAGELCPPPESLRGEHRWSSVVVTLPDGRQLERRAECVPLPGEAGGEAVSVLVLVSHDDLAAEELPPHVVRPQVLHTEIQRIRQRFRERFCPDQLVGRSAAMKKVRAQVATAIHTRCRVCISGAVGTGRETVARTIHAGRLGTGTGPLVPLSCRVLDAELLQTTVETFLRNCADLTEASPGTLLLMDVDLLTREAQNALLGILEISELDLQTLATSTRPLPDLLRGQDFRGELADAISTLSIHLPALAERPEDIPLLAQSRVEEANRQGGRQFSGFAEEAMDELVTYAWPGNIDQLRDVVAESISAAAGPLVTVADLPGRLRLAAEAAAHPPSVPERVDLDRHLADVEKGVIERALKQAKGNKALAARLLGINRPRLLRRIEQLKLR
jgi:DNA-binding NtrC family response regulator